MSKKAGTAAINARDLLWAPSDSLKDINRRAVLRAVMCESGTQANIARFLKLSPATISGVVNELHKEGILRVDNEEGERGNRVRLGAVRGVAVGVEVTHDGLAVAARRVDTSTVEYESISFDVNKGGGEAWIRESASLIKELTSRTGLEEDHIVSIGVGIPAAVDPRTGLITQVAPSLDWDLSGNVGQRFNEHFPQVHIIADNDAHFSAYGEYCHGAGRGGETMLFVKASTGIGAGLTIGSLIYRGRHGLAGEIGHLTMDPQGIVCRCGNRGCLETLVSGPRLVEEVRQAYAGYRVDLPVNLVGVIEKAKSGDMVCLRVLEDAARNIGLALARVCNLLNPELIVLGGEMGQAADLLIKPAMEGLRRHALRGMFNEESPIRMVGSELGLTGGARGALSFALKIDTTLIAK